MKLVKTHASKTAARLVRANTSKLLKEGFLFALLLELFDLCNVSHAKTSRAEVLPCCFSEGPVSDACHTVQGWASPKDHRSIRTRKPPEKPGMLRPFGLRPSIMLSALRALTFDYGN